MDGEIAYPKLIDRYQYARKEIPSTSFFKINYEKLRLILGDQLNSEHSWFKQIDNDSFVLAEMRQETDYVHHIQKVVAFSFRCVTFTLLCNQGHQAVYFQINANSNPNDLAKSSTLVSKNTTLKK
jgi:deoxyribodipyrimidine photolyase-related protein